jgi:hypothetical protein
MCVDFWICGRRYCHLSLSARERFNSKADGRVLWEGIANCGNGRFGSQNRDLGQNIGCQFDFMYIQTEIGRRDLLAANERRMPWRGREFVAKLLIEKVLR